jgi:hypothetical protein
VYDYIYLLKAEFMKWEELKVYRPLKKEELKPTFNKFTKIISNKLEFYGFKLVGRKLIRKSNDLFHIIHFDTRGSWIGISESFKIEISIVSIYDTDVFIKGFELTGTKKIENLIPKLRNYSRINQEYELLADYLTDEIVKHILPYFDKYDSSQKVLINSSEFKTDKPTELIERNENLVFYSELSNKSIKNSIAIIQKRINFYKQINTDLQMIIDAEEIQNHLKNKDWINIENHLKLNKRQIFKKLKIKDVA